MSSGSPLPAVMRSSVSNILVLPMRQGGHLPQLSSQANFKKYLANSTMQVVSSATIIPPEPMTAPAARSESKSTGVSRYSSGKQPPRGPPVCTALSFLPAGIPPPISKTISPKVMPIGTSIRPVRSTMPVRAKIAVPGLPSVPRLLNHSAPIRMMRGT